MTKKYLDLAGVKTVYNHVDSKIADAVSKIDVTAYATKADVDSKIAAVVGEAPEALDTLKEIADKLKEDGDAIGAINGVLEGKLTKAQADEAYQAKGNYLDYTDENGRKVIKFNNNDIIGAVPAATGADDAIIPVNGTWVSLIHLNRWNVVDLGDPKTIVNINTPKDVRPTVQEAGQSGSEAHKIAYLSDIEALKAELEALKAELVELKGNVPTEPISNAELEPEVQG